MILDYASTHGFHVMDLTFSPIKGPEGNIEYLVQLEKCEEPGDINEKIQIEKIVDEAFGNSQKRNKDMAERVLIVTNDGKDATMQ